jgi:hypothetical protein
MVMIKFVLALAAAVVATAPVAHAQSAVTSPSGVSLARTDPFSWTVNVAATQGTAGTITFNYLGANAAGTAWNFGYVLDNTSTSPSLSSRLGSFGFDTSGTVSSIIEGSTDRFSAALNAGNFNGLGTRDVCFYAGPNCNGGSNNGVTVAEAPVSGSFTLNFGAGLNALVIDNFVARWQAVGADANGSVSGGGLVVQTPVPEPSAWAMMILGLGLVGYTLRRRSAARTVALA